MLEEAYCDVDNDGYKVPVGGYSCYVQFQDMTAVPIRARGKTKFDKAKYFCSLFRS